MKNALDDPMRISWISGWASDIGQWRTEIESRWPGHSHLFLGYADLLPDPETLWQRNPALGESDHLVAWSLGTLSLLLSCPSRPPSQSWTLVAPIADFCAPGGWPRRAVQLMARQLPSDPARTLEAFAQRMGKADPLISAHWLGQALRYTPEELAKGLGALADKHADPERLKSLLVAPGTHCLWGASDQVVPPSQAALFPPVPDSRTLPGAGHWFTDYLDQLAF